MELDFKNDDLHRLCEQQRIAQKQLGTNSARKLRARLADMIAIDVVTELTTGNPHPLKGNRKGQFALNLAGGHRLVFEPNHKIIPCREDGDIDWSKISKVKIIFIGDYHD